MSTLIRLRWLVLPVLMLGLISACNFGSAAPQKEAEVGVKVEATRGEEAPLVDEPPAPAGDMAASAPAESRPEGIALAMTPSPAGESVELVPQQANPLRAGEVDDNAQWDDYLLYRRNYQGLPVHDRDVSERYV